MRLAWSVLGVVALGLGCVGSAGPEGPPGPPGPQGPPGPSGGSSRPCLALDGGAPGLAVGLSVSSPSNGQYFTSGEQAVLTVTLSADCGALLPADLGTANLYLAGPRRTLEVQTASQLLNAVTDPNAPDGQYQYIDLISPSFADAGENNLSVADGGTILYTLAPVTGEAAGTYTVGVWAKSKNDRDQVFQLRDMQIGTATPEQFASGPADASSCLSCHLGAANLKTYLHHIQPGYSPLGDFAIDSAPVGTCNLCHNNDGYSPNPTVRKVHGVHRGEHQLDAGVAHPDYGLGADPSLADYLDVGFPVLPVGDVSSATTAMEKDCTSCHVDSRWQTRPSRLACGTCHDNVFFDSGTLSPPTVLGKPSGGACTTSSQCSGFGTGAVCDTGTGNCQRVSHAVQPDDAQCATCHAPTVGVAPVSEVHSIPLYADSRGIRVTVTQVSGGTEPGGVFKPGDVPVVRFKLSDRTGNNIGDLLTNPNLAGSAVGAGPNQSPRRIYGTATGGALTMTKGTLLTYDAPSQTYTFVFPSGWPVSNLAPVNTTDPSLIHPNPAGPYTLYVYVAETLQPSGARDSSGAVTTVKFVPTAGTPAGFPAIPRDVITQPACDACHVKTQAHGGGRADPDGCFTCHNVGGMDRTVGATGTACTVNTDCGGFNGANPAVSWEACNAGTCTITQDPTPHQTVDFRAMIHMIHFGRLLEGYSERDNLVFPGLEIVGFNNTPNDFSEVLLPQDVRNCTTCHADTLASCSDSAPCGWGQSCTSGRCTNTGWQTPTATVCLSCHDAADAYGHAQANTATIGGVQVEACDVCHGVGKTFSVSTMHNITSPYVPPYPREMQ